MPEATGTKRKHLPDPSEYAAYYGRYIDLLEDRPIPEILEEQAKTTLAFLRSIPESSGTHRYEPGKWSIKDLIGHVNDAERVFSHRALRFARADTTALPSFEHDDYVRAARSETRSLRDLIDEFEAIRRSTVALFRSFGVEELARSGIAAENRVSVRALGGIIASHERHHVRILKERYLA